MNAIEVKDLTKTYRGFKLDRVSFTLPSGCIMGLVGENGAGKSTIIRCLLDIIRKRMGTVRLLEKDDINEAKEDIGFVLDDVGLPSDFNAKEIDRVLKHAYKKWNSDRFFELLERFDLPLNKQLQKLSKGMKMKMGIAAALSHEAKLLILDEPTSGLDPIARDDIVDILNEFTRNEEHSVLISSHIVSDLEKLCDYITFVSRGRVILSEEKDILLEKYGIIQTAPEILSELDENAIAGKRLTKYGAEALVRRDMIPDSFEIMPVTIEELFVFMVRDARHEKE